MPGLTSFLSHYLYKQNKEDVAELPKKDISAFRVFLSPIYTDIRKREGIEGDGFYPPSEGYQIPWQEVSIKACNSRYN